MKSSSSPAGSSASFDANIYSQRPRCILSVLRRMLCSSSLPTHPSDHILESCSAAQDKMMEKPAVDNAVPGLVARLMGLDSIPERITRSRSLNSADRERSRGKLHRRSKTSLSFRESPTFVELDDDEFIVLRFDREKTSSAGNDEEHKQSKACRAGSFHGGLQPIVEAVKKPSEPERYNHRQACNRVNSRSKKQIRLVEKKVTTQSSDSEESSPVSIFDFHQSQTDQGTETPTSADEDSWTRSSSSSSRISSPEQEQDNTKITTEQDDEKTEAVESRKQQKKHALLNKTVAAVVVGKSQKRNRDMWGRVCDITVAEIKGAAVWGDKDVKDLAAEFEVQIINQLLNELLH